MESTKRISKYLDELFSEGSLADCFVIDIVQHGSKGITVYFDSDSGVSFEKCTQVSRYLEKRMDEDKVLNGDYVLDVSSPGVDRPLKYWRQYPRHIGRDLLVTMKDGQTIEGKLTSLGIDEVILVSEGEELRIPFAEIEKAFVQIRF